MRRIEPSIEDLYRAGAVLRTENDPIKTTFDENLANSMFTKKIADSHESLPKADIDRVFATYAETTDLTTLSPSHVDALEHAIQIGLVDDDALLTFCFNIKRNLQNNPVKMTGAYSYRPSGLRPSQ
jgi:hypothetical protein